MKKLIVCFFVMVLGSMPLMAQEEREPIDQLVLAVAQGKYEEVQRLLDAGVDPNQRGIDPAIAMGWTPLALAVSRGDSEIVESLIRYRANVNLEVTDTRQNGDYQGTTPLMLATAAFIQDRNDNRTTILQLLGESAKHEGRTVLDWHLEEFRDSYPYLPSTVFDYDYPSHFVEILRSFEFSTGFPLNTYIAKHLIEKTSVPVPGLPEEHSLAGLRILNGHTVDRVALRIREQCFSSPERRRCLLEALTQESTYQFEEEQIQLDGNEEKISPVFLMTGYSFRFFVN